MYVQFSFFVYPGLRQISLLRFIFIKKSGLAHNIYQCILCKMVSMIIHIHIIWYICIHLDVSSINGVYLDIEVELEYLNKNMNVFDDQMSMSMSINTLPLSISML